MRHKPSEPVRAQWTGRPERGSALLARVMMSLSLHLGRPVARSLLHLIAAYFFVFAPAARRHSRAYLRRALGREPTSSDRYRHVFTFASTLLDRFYLTRERYDLLDISIEGEELLHAAFERGTGAFLLGAHVGSFELMSAVGRRQPGLRVALAMYTHNMGQIAARLAYGPSASAPEIIPLGQMESMLRVRDALATGKFVGMLADRSFEDAPGHSVSFLGAPALFPTGPMRAAAAMRTPVIFMAGLYRGGNRYHVLFRALADFSQPTALARAAAVSAAIERYAALLEECCRSEPYNWFNFYDFWHGAGESVTPRRSPHGRAQLGGVLLACALALGGHPGRSAAAPSAEDQPGFEQLLKLLSERRQGHVTFTEVQRLSILEKPLHSSGELLYVAPDRLEKRTLEPRPEDLRLEHGVLSVERDHHRRSVALAEFPQAVPFIESVRATLAGDRAALERYFTVDFSGDLGHWTLELLPIDATMRRSVRRILISGERDHIHTVDIQQTDGDSSTLTLGPELAS
jgi:predicted LPLAT superfamily acyltransferase